MNFKNLILVSLSFVLAEVSLAKCSAQDVVSIVESHMKKNYSSCIKEVTNEGLDEDNYSVFLAKMYCKKDTNQKSDLYLSSYLVTANEADGQCKTSVAKSFFGTTVR